MSRMRLRTPEAERTARLVAVPTLKQLMDHLKQFHDLDNRVAIAKRLKRLHRKRRKMPGDGNCLFHVLVYHLAKNPAVAAAHADWIENARALRTVVCDRLATPAWQNRITAVFPDLNLDQANANLRADSHWDSDYADFVLHVISELFQIRVRVIAL
jgi:hypothetical protein